MRWLVVAIFALSMSCSDRVEEQRGVIDPGIAGGDDSDAGAPPVVDSVRSLCSPGTARCVGENSPFIERCEADGESRVRDQCEPGEVCRNRRCVPFACTPGTSVCVGNLEATCDPTGAAVVDAEECSDSSVCEGGSCVDLCARAVRNGSYIGCEYVAARLPNFYDAEFSDDVFPFGVVVANSNAFAEATVSFTRGTVTDGDPVRLWTPDSIQLANGRSLFVQSEILAADGTTEPIDELPVTIPPGGAAVVLVAEVDKLVRIRSNRPVSAYQFSPYCCNSTYTNDGSLLFPVNTWGSRYRAIGYPSFPYVGDPYLAVLSTTGQQIQLDADRAVRVDGSPVEPGESFTVMANQTTLIAPLETSLPDRPDQDSDLSGIALTSEQPFAVFSGHPCTFAPEDLFACDHLEEQLPPANTLGRSYLLSPIRRRAVDSKGEGVYWRITADESATLRFDPPFSELNLIPAASNRTRQCSTLVTNETLTLAAGETCEFGTLDGLAVTSTGDVIVAGVLSGQESTGLASLGANAGDPSLFVVPPAAQFRNNYAFIAPPTYARNHVTIAAPAGQAVVLDGRNIEAAFRNQLTKVRVDGQTWDLFVVAIEPGLHSIESERPFGIMVYAMDDYVSYAFVGGLDLLPKGSD